MITIFNHKITITCDRCGRIRQFDFIEADAPNMAYNNLLSHGWKISMGGGGIMSINTFAMAV